MPRTFPEINAIATIAECNAALVMGRNCYDSVKPEFQPELRERLKAIEERRRRLTATAERRACCDGVGLHTSNCPRVR